MLSKSPTSKTLDKTPKQTKLVPKIQSEQKDDSKKNNKKRKSLPANLINGSDDISPKMSKLEPFSGTSDIFMQKKKNPENKSMETKKEVKESKVKSSTNKPKVADGAKEPKTAELRKRKRSIDIKAKRIASKSTFKKTLTDAAAGDVAAITLVKSKIADLEQKEKLTNSAKRKLRLLKKTLKGDKDTEAKPLHSSNKVGKQQPNVTQKGKNKKAVNDNVNDEVLTKKDIKNKSKKSLLTKAPVESKEESDNDEEDEEESENETSNLIDSESLEDENDGEGEDEEDESEEDTEEDESEENDDEEEDDSDDAAEEESDEKMEEPNIEPPKKKGKTTPIQKEDPENVNSPTRNKSQLTLFVGNIPFDATQEDIAEHFSKAGNIKDIRIPVDKKTNKSRGFAYVELQDQTSYQKGLSFHHSSLKGRKINVMDSESNKKSNNTHPMKQGGRPFGNNRGRGGQRGRQNMFRGNKRY